MIALDMHQRGSVKAKKIEVMMEQADRESSDESLYDRPVLLTKDEVQANIDRVNEEAREAREKMQGEVKKSKANPLMASISNFFGNKIQMDAEIK